MSYNLYRSTPLIAKRSRIPDKLGELPRKAKKEIMLLDREAGHFFITTDLALAKYKRAKRLDEFSQTYLRLFKTERISILIVIVDAKHFKKPSNFYKDFFKKLYSKNIQVLGYFWQRDIGEVEFKTHFHFMIATTRIDKTQLPFILKRNKINSYKVELCNNVERFKGYLNEKEMYAPDGGKNYGSSRFYKKPLQLL